MNRIGAFIDRVKRLTTADTPLCYAAKETLGNFPIPLRDEGELICWIEDGRCRARGNYGQDFPQRPNTWEILVQLAHAGVEINPQTIRALTTTDEILASGHDGTQARRIKTDTTGRIQIILG